jgi:hypothetical protein
VTTGDCVRKGRPSISWATFGCSVARPMHSRACPSLHAQTPSQPWWKANKWRVSRRVLRVQDSGSLIGRGSSAGTLRGHLIEKRWRRLPDRGTDRQRRRVVVRWCRYAGLVLVLALVVVYGDVIIVFKSTRRGMMMMAHGHQNRNAEGDARTEACIP